MAKTLLELAGADLAPAKTRDAFYKKVNMRARALTSRKNFGAGSDDGETVGQFR